MTFFIPLEENSGLISIHFFILSYSISFPFVSIQIIGLVLYIVTGLSNGAISESSPV
jgi:hypothetical protein|nr:MAG TPA: Lipopolysaccharide assembly protein A domain [Caudoviricetes sp.]DAR42879.1 MAG TPA: Lipopolysaccharide assembly protein A domain [Caudoviricetes sp.]